MSKLLIVEGSNIVRGVLKELLDETQEFNYVLTGSFQEAKKELSKTRYEFAVVERTLKDAPNGEIIALLNKHNVAPIVHTNDIDEDFFEVFEGAQIVDYIQKQKNDNLSNVIAKLHRLKANKKVTILIVNDSHIYTTYLKQNLNLHSFRVITASNNEDAMQKIELHPDIKLMIVDNSEPYVNALELIQDVRVKKQSQDMKILIMVEEANLYETARCLNAGADDYIVKQFSRDEFYVRVYQNIN